MSGSFARVLLLGLVACGRDEATPPNKLVERPYSDCDPISYGYCSVPFPSSFYLRDDPSTATGVRVHLGPTTLPYTDQDALAYQPDPALWNARDGFSPLSPLLVEFPNLALTGLPDHGHIGDSLLPDAPIVILDADTGEVMPHFAEFDETGVPSPGKFLLIYPATPLRYGHRYVVAIRNLVDAGGQAIAPSAGYLSLRDGTPTDNWDIEGRRQLYEEIYGVLEGYGWARAETQLAWDFTVSSVDAVAGRAVAIREDLLATIGEDGPSYTITEINDGDAGTGFNEHIFRRILGTMTVPLYTEFDGPGTLLTRDGDGMPYANGETTVPFTILVPHTAVTDPRALPLLQYGHGLLGSQDEVEGSYLGEMANRYGFVVFAVDWTGMKGEDSDAITLMLLEDLGSFGFIPERMQQGFAEFQAAARMMTGNMSKDAALAFADPVSGEAVPVVDPETLYYYGNSQGGIYGGTYMALSKDIQRGVLGVPGMPYALLLPRSADFEPFFWIFQSVYDDQRDIMFLIAAMQMLWDEADPAGFGRLMNEEPLADTPAKDILIQDAIGDAQVTTLGAHIMARAYGAHLIETPVNEVWGLEVAPSGSTGSALTEFEFGAPEVPFTNLPPDADFDTHEDTRRNLPAQDQLWGFLTTGEVHHYCDGACDPE